MRFSFLPAEVRYYDCFEQASANFLQAARLLEKMLDHFENAEEQARQITDYEHKGDLIVHNVTNLLPRTLITPIDLEDILRLISAEDDAMDAVEEVALRLIIYQVEQVREPARSLAHLIVEAGEQMDKAFHGLRDKKQFGEVREHIIQINTIEERADQVLNDALSELVAHRQDLFDFLRWKEIYELLEATTDRLEDAGDVIQRVIIENA